MSTPCVVIAYDGSELSRSATREAAGLFPGQPVVVATVWEPGLALVATRSSYGYGYGYGDGGVPLAADPAAVAEVDRAQHEHASVIAQEGADLATSLGLTAEPHVTPDDSDVADTLIDLARQRNAAAVVVGSHGITGIRSRLLGSVARKLIAHCDRPVVVIRGEGS